MVLGCNLSLQARSRGTECEREPIFECGGTARRTEDPCLVQQSLYRFARFSPYAQPVPESVYVPLDALLSYFCPRLSRRRLVVSRTPTLFDRSRFTVWGQADWRGDHGEGRVGTESFERFRRRARRREGRDEGVPGRVARESCACESDPYCHLSRGCRGRTRRTLIRKMSADSFLDLLTPTTPYRQ